MPRNNLDAQRQLAAELLRRYQAGYRRCGACHRMKLLAEFGVRRASFDGCQAYCKPCTRAYNATRPDRHRAKAA